MKAKTKETLKKIRKIFLISLTISMVGLVISAIPLFWMKAKELADLATGFGISSIIFLCLIMVIEGNTDDVINENSPY